MAISRIGVLKCTFRLGGKRRRPYHQGLGKQREEFIYTSYLHERFIGQSVDSIQMNPSLANIAARM